MMTKNLFTTALLTGFLSLSALTASADTETMFLVGGQSNTDGRISKYSLVDDLAYLNAPISNCMYSAHGTWPDGSTVAFANYDASLASYWAYDGILYYWLAKNVYTEKPFYVVKTSYGGTSIDPSVSNSGSTVTYDGGTGTQVTAPYYQEDGAQKYGNGYHWSANSAFLADTYCAGSTFIKNGTTYSGQSMLLTWMKHVDAAIDQLTAAGDDVDIKAIIWHQGESDKMTVYGKYQENLKEMVAYIRQHLATKLGDNKYLTLPFYCGTIPHASFLYNSTIEKAFFNLDNEDPNFHAIDLRDLTMLSDGKHFDAHSAELFGKRLYNRMIGTGLITADSLDVKDAETDYSDFKTDEFVGETTTWKFDNQSGSFYSGSQIINHMYLHGGGSTQSCFEYKTGQTGQELTFSDTTFTSTSYVRSNLASMIEAQNVSDSYNASTAKGNCAGINVKYPGTLTLQVAVEGTATFSVCFNGKVIATVVGDGTGTTITPVTYKAEKAGTFYIVCTGAYKLWGARYAVDDNTLKCGLRLVYTDDDGYVTFGNITNANLGLPAGLKAYAVIPSDEDDTKVVLKSMSGVNNGDAALLKGEPNTVYVLPFAWEPIEDVTNFMTPMKENGLVEEGKGTDFINYTYANKKFTKGDGTVATFAGRAYLALSDGAAQCSNNDLTFDERISVDPYYFDTKTNFGTDASVFKATTWLTGDMTNPGSDGTVQTLNGLYGRGQSGSDNCSFFKSTSTGSGTFSDGTAVEWTEYLYNNEGGNSSWTIDASTHANNTTCSDYLAFNAAVPGTFYLLFSGHTNSKGTTTAVMPTLYFEGESVVNDVNSESPDDIKELKYTSTTAGTFILNCQKTGHYYAIRFVPTDSKGVYYEVGSTGWATVSLPYAAKPQTDTKVYYASAYTESGETGTLTVTEETDAIPEEAGFLFNGKQGVYCLESSETDNSWSSNYLVGTANGAATVDANSVYVLAKLSESSVGFKQYAGTSIAQYKAYLSLPSSSGAKNVMMIFDDPSSPTAINAIGDSSLEKKSRDTYNLAGQKVNASYRGIVIRDGVKFIK